jgi:DNA-binding Lrp family transcriptional regulator
MVRKALILGQLAVCEDKPRATLEKISLLDGVKEAEYITGPYDFYLKVEVKSQNELSKIVDQIRGMKDIKETMTCLVLPSKA